MLRTSDVLRDRHQVTIFDKDRLQRGGEGLDLAVKRGFLRRFERDLERRALEILRRAEYAVEALRDDAVARGEAVDPAFAIAREELFGLAQRGFEEVFREYGAGHVAVKAVTGVVGVQGDYAVESVKPDLGLKKLDFRHVGIVPEFAVEVLAAARVAGVVLKPRGIADRIEEQAVALGQFRIFLERGDESRQRQSAFGFVAVDGGEDSDADGVPSPARAEKDVTRNIVGPTGALELAERFPDEMVRSFGDLVQLRQEPVDRAALGQGLEARGHGRSSQGG